MSFWNLGYEGVFWVQGLKDALELNLPGLTDKTGLFSLFDDVFRKFVNSDIFLASKEFIFDTKNETKLRANRLSEAWKAFLATKPTEITVLLNNSVFVEADSELQPRYRLFRGTKANINRLFVQSWLFSTGCVEFEKHFAALDSYARWIDFFNTPLGRIWRRPGLLPILNEQEDDLGTFWKRMTTDCLFNATSTFDASNEDVTFAEMQFLRGLVSVITLYMSLFAEKDHFGAEVMMSSPSALFTGSVVKPAVLMAFILPFVAETPQIKLIDADTDGILQMLGKTTGATLEQLSDIKDILPAHVPYLLFDLNELVNPSRMALHPALAGIKVHNPILMHGFVEIDMANVSHKKYVDIHLIDDVEFDFATSKDKEYFKNTTLTHQTVVVLDGNRCKMIDWLLCRVAVDPTVDTFTVVMRHGAVDQIVVDVMLLWPATTSGVKRKQ